MSTGRQAGKARQPARSVGLTDKQLDMCPPSPRVQAMTPLHYAAYKGHSEVVKALIAAKADPNLAHVRPARRAARPSRSPASHGCLAPPPCSAPVLREELSNSRLHPRYPRTRDGWVRPDLGPEFSVRPI